MPLDIASFYLSHRDLCKAVKGKKSGQLIWHTKMWYIWLLRNDVIFNNEKVDFLGLTDLIRVQSWSWLKAIKGTLVFSFTDWCRCPLVCLSSLSGHALSVRETLER